MRFTQEHIKSCSGLALFFAVAAASGTMVAQHLLKQWESPASSVFAGAWVGFFAGWLAMIVMKKAFDLLKRNRL